MDAPSLLRQASPLLFTLLALALTHCAEGLSNAPGINRSWTQQDFQHDVISNGPESCPRDNSQDPLAPEGQMRRQCPEQSTGRPRTNMPASP